MAGNKTLELSIKIAGKVDKSLINAISAAQGNVSGLSTTLSRVGTAGLAAMGALATGTVASLAKCTDAAKDFETQMSDVVKYVDGLADKNGEISDKIASTNKIFKDGDIHSVRSVKDQNVYFERSTYAQNYEEMKSAILDLSTQIPYTAEELTRLAAAAGQSGKSMNDLIEGGFLKDVAMMGTAWDISADQAGDWAAKWEVAFGKNHEEIMELADQINYLGAHNATTAAEIAQVVNEAAGLGQVAGMDVDATAALGTAMLAMGVDTAKAANSINRMYTNMSKGESATKAQKEMWQELGFTATEIAASMQKDASGTMLRVFEAVQQLPDERQVAALSTLFGQWAITGAAKLTGNLDTFKQALSAIDNKDLYNNSMNREFVIKSETSEALDTRMKSAMNAFQVDIGTAFLPAKKEISGALIDFMNQLRSMPELGQIAQQLATLFSQGVNGAAEALQNALPYIQQFLGYLVNNGPQVLSFLGKLAVAFTAMKFAPGIESLLRGAGGLVFGSQTGGSTHTGSGGIVGLMSSLFRGGQNAVSGSANAVTTLIPSLIASAGGILSTARIDAQLNGRGLLGTLLGGAGTLFGHTGVGQYLGGIGSSLGNFLQATGLTKVGSVTGEILSNISQATGLTDLVSGVAGGIRGMGGWVAGKAGGLAQGAAGLAGRVVNSAPAQAIGGVLKSGAGLLGNVWGPMASGFGGLLSGALPIVGVISSIIAVVSILGDKFGGLNGILDGIGEKIGGTFGPQALEKFNGFREKLSGVIDTVTGLFQDGGVAKAMEPLHDAVTGMFGDGAGAAFDGLVQILQSIMSVAGQVVSFATTTVKPIIQEIFSFITQTVVPIILQTFTAAAPAISGILSGLGSAVMTCMQVIGLAIQTALPIVESIISAVLSVASVVIPALLAGYEVFSSGIAEIASAIQSVFQGILDFVTGVFTGNWSQAWQGVLDSFGGIWDGLGALVKTPLNAAIVLINQAISAINGIHVTAPDWPVLGDLAGKEFGFNIPQIPMLAKGGFTTGPSIAGEAGTEAVISFQRSARSSNIATWAKAGQMLGVANRPTRLESFDTDSGWPSGGGGGGTVNFTYAPQITIQGNADRQVIEQAVMESEQRMKAWVEGNMDRLYTRVERERSRRGY